MTNDTEIDVGLLHPSMLTKIEQRLRELHIEKKRINVCRGSVKGDNYLGVIAKIDITGKTEDGKETTLHWVAKSAPTQQTFRELVNIDKCFMREMYMYQDVFPEFLKFQEGKNLEKPFKNFAPVHVSCLEEFKECFVMENMKELGFRLQDRFKPMDWNHVSLIMKEYGRYHALSFALRDQKPEIFKRLASNTHENFFSSAKGNDAMVESFSKNIERAIQALDPIKDKEAYMKLQDMKDKVLDLMIDVLQPDVAGDYSVIIHGDSWINNMLFKYDDESRPDVPTEMLFLDFQLSIVGSPCLDLSYFLLTCTDKEMRDENWDRILEEYYKSFSTFLRELGSDPSVMFPRSVMDQHMKKFSMYGFNMSMMVLYLMMSESDDIPDFANMTVEDVKNSMDFPTKNLDVCNKRIRDVILDCIAREFI